MYECFAFALILALSIPKLMNPLESSNLLSRLRSDHCKTNVNKSKQAIGHSYAYSYTPTKLRNIYGVSDQ